MYSNETAEHHRDHRCRNKEVNQFCYNPISKYRGNSCGCITRHHPVWAGSRSWVSRHLSLHLSIRGDEVRVRSCLIFRYRIWPKKNNVYWKSIVICYKNIIRVDYCWPSLISICHLMKQENIAIYLPVLQRFDSAFFKPYQIWMFTQAWRYIIHLRYFPLWMQKTSLCHTKFQVCTLKINTIFCHRKKNPLLLNRSV